jgi:hypothetical protein
MFGLVLAIGLLVDDAIVVVENVERVMEEEGLSPVEATRKAMGQISGTHRCGGGALRGVCAGSLLQRHGRCHLPAVLATIVAAMLCPCSSRSRSLRHCARQFSSRPANGMRQEGIFRLV